MSSPDVHSNHSFPSDLTLSPPNLEQNFLPQEDASERRAPRLSSPHHFRDIFAGDSVNTSSRSNWNLPPINYRETMDGVNRALQSANRAIQNAQEAFQSRRTPSNSSHRHDVVDLTSSPPNAATRAAADERSIDAFLSRIHPHDSSARPTASNRFLHEPVYGAGSLPFPDESYGGPDSLTGPRRRFEMQRRSHIGLPNTERSLFRSAVSDARRQDEEDAIRRQRIARQQWEESQKRTSERQRLETQRQRLLNSPELQRNSLPTNQNSSPARPTSSSSNSSSIEAVDLTNVDDNDALAQVLSKQRQDAISSQKPSSTMPKDNLSADTDGRTPFTSYKCPICMESPQFPTSTSCGHLFCHKCIIDTLKWSENARREEGHPNSKLKGVCPVCRKQMSRNDKPGTGRTLIPLEIKAITKGELKRKRQEEEEKQQQLKKRREDKGKGRAVEESDDEIVEVKDIHDKTGNGRSRKRAKTVVKLGDDNDDSIDNFLDDELFGIDDYPPF